MPSVTRRGLLVLGGTGAAGIVLSGCGEATDPREESDPEALTAAESEAEANLSGAYVVASQVAAGKQRAALEQFAEAAKQRAAEFGQASPPPPPDGGPDSAEALSACANLANDAIAAHLQSARLLDETAGRALASSALAACAAELAVVNGFAGEQQAPHAFVTGGEHPPLESFDRPDSDESETTSTSTTDTTDTSAEQ